LQDFLFSPDRARTSVRYLSGGERNRVLLARLFAKPANVIVLDEPTNDLDTETLELLEQRLVEYQGTVLLVSHDRAFLNNVVTSTIVFERGDQAYGVKEYVGGYDDWIRQRSPEPSKAKSTEREKSAPASHTVAETAAPRKRRLTFKEQQELSALPQAIERLEADIAQLHEAMAQADFYRQPREQIAAEQARLESLEQQLTTSFERWEALDRLAG
jgi:ATP-binding cassette subfamily F protein uup